MKANKIIVLFLCIILAFGLMACGPTSKELAEVNGVKVTAHEVRGFSALAALINYGIPYESFPEENKVMFEYSALILLTDVQLIKQDYAAQGIEVLTAEDTEAVNTDAQAVYDELLKTFTTEQLDNYHITLDIVKAYFETQKYDARFMQDVNADNPISDEQIKNFYEENIDMFVTQSKAVDTSHILMGDENHTDEDREAIEAIRERALAGEDFAELAKEYSKDEGSAALGGQIGFADESSNLVQSYKDAMLALEAGEISEVIESNFGFHIIKANSIREAGQQTLEEARDAVIKQLENENRAAATKQLREEYGIKWHSTLTIDETTSLPTVDSFMFAMP